MDCEFIKELSGIILGAGFFILCIALAAGMLLGAWIVRRGA